MQEIYSETYLKAKASPQRVLARVFLIVLAAVMLLFGLMIMLSGSVLIFIAMAVVAAIIYFVLPPINIAYEYIFVDGQIDFDRISNGAKRKTLKRIDMENVEVVAPQDSHRLDPYQRASLVDYSSGYATDRHYIAVFTGDKGTEKILFTPDEKMLSMMRMKAPSKIAEE